MSPFSFYLHCGDIKTLQVTEQPKTSSTMILALNNMKGFDTDVLAILQQTTTTSVNTVSTSYLEPEFAVGLLDDQEEKEERSKGPTMLSSGNCLAREALLCGST